MSARQLARLGRTVGVAGLVLVVLALALTPAHFTGLHLLAVFAALVGAVLLWLAESAPSRAGGTR